MSAAEALAGASRVRVEVPDTNGILRGKQVPAAKVGAGKGCGFADVVYCLTSTDGVFENPDFTSHDTGWPDLVAVPDLATARPVPWEPGLAAVLCDMTTQSADPVELDPRRVLRLAVERLQALGLDALCGVEYELFLFNDDEPGRQALRAGRARDLTPAGFERQAYSLLRWPDLAPFANAMFELMEPYGVPLGAISTELGYGMVEIAVSPLPPLEAADAAARLKLGCKEVARRHGLIASFIAKWDMGQSGSSGHVHCSLVREDTNALWAGPRELDGLARAALGGLLSTAAELSVFMSPFPNSYRRYQPETWVPLNVTWGHDNRNACVRFISVAPELTRFEHRRPGADLNPYLSIAACLDGCAEGIEKGIEPAPEAPGRAWDYEEAEPFPGDLPEATRRLSSSAFARDRYGDAFVDHYVLSREAEQAEWLADVRDEADLNADQVPDREARRFLNVV
jgi:glutamine synthetase